MRISDLGTGTCPSSAHLLLAAAAALGTAALLALTALSPARADARIRPDDLVPSDAPTQDPDPWSPSGEFE